MKIRGLRGTLLGSFVLAGLASTSWAAQPPGPPPPRSAREAAQTDFTGNWVAQVTEDWRWRMLTAPVGDTEGIPMNPAGIEQAKKWDLAADNAAGNQCRAYGAAAIMRQPTRVRVSWADDNTLKFEMDAGTQTRLFHFGTSAPASTERSLQGFSVAEWMRPPPARTGNALNQQEGLPGRTVTAPTGAPVTFSDARGSLKVQTSRLTAGYLRKNGVPYSENAVVTEYYDRLQFFGVDYLQVTTIVQDPTYLGVPYIVSNQFKREADGSRWSPSPCRTDPPGKARPPIGNFGIQGRGE